MGGGGRVEGSCSDCLLREVGSIGPAAIAFVGLVLEVEEFEPAHRLTQFCTLHESCPISPEYFCKCNTLWN